MHKVLMITRDKIDSEITHNFLFQLKIKKHILMLAAPPNAASLCPRRPTFNLGEGSGLITQWVPPTYKCGGTWAWIAISSFSHCSVILS